jgi:hypothetical protein
MPNFDQSPAGQALVSATMQRYTNGSVTEAATAGLGPQPRPIRYVIPPDGQIYPDSIPAT